MLPAPIRIPIANDHLACFDTGKAAPPLVLLHGAMGSAESELADLFPYLEPHFRVIAIDFAGHGRSSGFDGIPFSLELFSQNVLDVLDHLEISRTHLFGFSMGAATGLYLAHLAQERLDRVVLLGTNVRWAEHDVAAMAHLLDMNAFESRQPKAYERLRMVHGENDPGILAERLRTFTQGLPDLQFPETDMHAIKTPIQIIHGDSDQLFNVKHAHHLHEHLPHSDLMILPDAPHLIRQINPSTIADAIIGFCSLSETGTITA